MTGRVSIKTCSVETCEHKAHARGYCNTHYSRWRDGRPINEPYRLRLADDGDRFDAAIEMDPNGGCWLWSGASSDFGHGIATVGGELVRAHRHAYERWVGPIPVGMKICHRCDVPPCVNPGHLFVGTQAENLADMVAKGRYVQGRVYRGSSNASAKLTEDDALRIRTAVAAGRSFTDVANDNGVSRHTVRRIATGQGWTHLPQEVA